MKDKTLSFVLQGLVWGGIFVSMHVHAAHKSCVVAKLESWTALSTKQLLVGASAVGFCAAMGYVIYRYIHSHQFLTDIGKTIGIEPYDQKIHEERLRILLNNETILSTLLPTYNRDVPDFKNEMRDKVVGDLSKGANLYVCIGDIKGLIGFQGNRITYVWAYPGVIYMSVHLLQPINLETKLLMHTIDNLLSNYDEVCIDLGRSQYHKFVTNICQVMGFKFEKLDEKIKRGTLTKKQYQVFQIFYRANPSIVAGETRVS